MHIIEIIASSGQRLDQIYFKYFNDQTAFTEFLKLNKKYLRLVKKNQPNLQNLHLIGGEIIKIPILKKDLFEINEKIQNPLLNK